MAGPDASRGSLNMISVGLISSAVCVPLPGSPLMAEAQTACSSRLSSPG